MNRGRREPTRRVFRARALALANRILDARGARLLLSGREASGVLVDVDRRDRPRLEHFLVAPSLPYPLTLGPADTLDPPLATWTTP